MRRRLRRLGAYLLTVLVAVASTYTFIVAPGYASVANPTVTLREAHAFQRVITDDTANGTYDMLFVGRYELLLADWQDATWMLDATCDDADDIQDRCYTSLGAGNATLVLKDTAGDIVASVDAPRIADGMAALYLCESGDPNCQGQTSDVITWDAPAAQLCIRGPSTVSPRPESCLSLQYHTAANVTATQTEIREAFVSMVYSVQKDGDYRRGRLTFVGVITEEGAIFAQEAFPAVTLVAPAAFERAVEKSTSSFAPTPASTPIATSKDVSTETVSVAFGRFATVTSTSIGLLGSIFMSILAIGVVIYVAKTTGKENFAVGAALGYLVLLTGSFLGLVPWAGTFILAIVTIVIGTAWWFRSQQPG